jgi:hypothetical protein
MAVLITETSNKIVTESIGKDLYVSGIFSSAGVKNKNGRVYEKSILDREMNRVMSQVNEKSLYGQLNHPEKPEIDLEKVAILVEDLYWKGDDIIGKAKVLNNTYCGGILKGIIESGGRVGISSRGLGTVNEDGKVNEDYNLICWDIVSDASNPGSKYINGIYEGKEFTINNTNTSSKITIEEAKKEAYKHIYKFIKNIEKTI